MYRQSLEKKNYRDAAFLSDLQQIALFFDTIQFFNDYVTWVQGDQMKSKYSAVGNYFKSKTNFYKKEEETVKRFNTIFSDFDN